MRITSDKRAGAVYFYLKGRIKSGGVARTISTYGMINIDMDKDGEVIGIELLPTSDSVSRIVRSARRKVRKEAK